MEQHDRYIRQTMLPQIGEQGQRRIAAASVLVVGLGGLGSPVAAYLAGAGIGRLGLCDSDTVSLSNLHRQVLYSTQQQGIPKTCAATERLAAINPGIELVCHDVALDKDNIEKIVAGYDLVVDCCDNFRTRYLLDDVCVQLGKTWIYGSVGEFSGQVAVMNGVSGMRYSDLYPDREALCAKPPAVMGAFGPVPGIVGAVEASEALKIVAGFGRTLDGQMFIIDIFSMETDIIEL